jgi:serine/threonine protein kinase
VSEELEAPTVQPPGYAAGISAGSRLAGYRLEQPIGRGGMAVVFRAVDERLGRAVALKVLAPELAADDAFRQRFIRESRAAAAVDDPHIIPVFQAGDASGVLFIAMRYVPGGDVRTLVQREGPMAAARAAAIISPVASALDTAHAAGLIHRDVKPANMLVDVRPDRPDHVYLSDFGLSKTSMSSGLTGTGQFLGTVDYCAPEQIDGRAVDGRADQYALACTAFELLTGAPPFLGDRATATIWAHMSQPPPLLTARRPDLPLAANQVLVRAMAKTPELRYPTCHEFASALRDALALPPYQSGVGVPADPASSRRVSRPWKRDWTAWALLLAVPVIFTGALISPLGPAANAIGFSLFLIGVLAIPAATIAKLTRWLRRSRRRKP